MKRKWCCIFPFVQFTSIVRQDWTIHFNQCVTCYAYWPLSAPANDTTNVLVEIRAAEIALVVGLGPPRVSQFNDGAEHAGWIEHAFDSNKVPEQPGEWAGWLARQIARGDHFVTDPQRGYVRASDTLFEAGEIP